jgi:hypothetical protein
MRGIIKYISDRWILLSFAGVILFFVFIGVKGEFKDYVLNHYSEVKKGVVISSKNYKGNNTRNYSYSYKFMEKGESYLGDSRDNEYKVGDSVLVEYWPRFPNFNRLKK